MARTIDVDEYIADLAKGGLDLVLAGQTFHVDDPQLWPDDLVKQDLVGQATAVLGGPERYAEFVAAGGRARMLQVIIEKDMGLTVPESVASSSS